MSRYSKKDILRLVEEDDVEFIRLQFTDIFGNLKNVAITVSQLEKALDNECMFTSCPAPDTALPISDTAPEAHFSPQAALRMEDW